MRVAKLLAIGLLLIAGPVRAQAPPQLGSAVDSAVKAACGNCTVGVSIGNPSDETTWRLDFAAGATAAQQAQAAAAIAALTPAQWQARAQAPLLLAAALAAGCQISSSSTPALNGTYAIDPASQQQVAAISLYIQVNGKFPAGETALAWPDASGVTHSFPAMASFQAFATALGDYVTALALAYQATLAGSAWSPPAMPVVIP